MNAISKRLLSWLCVIAMVLSFAPAIDLSGFAVETKAVETESVAAEPVETESVEPVAVEPEVKEPVSEKAPVMGGQNITQAVSEKIQAARDIQQAALALDPTTATSCPICGDGVTWVTPTIGSIGQVTAEGKYHYYFGEDTLVKQRFAWMELRANNSTVCLVLNTGSTPKAINGMIGMRGFSNSTINIMGNAVITSDGNQSEAYGSGNESPVYLKGTNNTINLYGGTFIYTKDSAGTSGAITVVGKNTINMYNDVTVGPETKPTTPCYNVHVGFDSTNAPTIATAVTFNMYGGTIRNGLSAVGTSSGNVQLERGTTYFARPTFNMYGGSITGGAFKSGTSATWGGNVYAEGGSQVSIYGGTISGGSAVRGGNIAMESSSSSKLNISGGTISGGTATTGGGNIYIRGAATLEGYGLLQGGTSPLGGSIYIDSSRLLTLKGGKISGGNATNLGGNIYVSGATVTQTDGTVTAGTATNNGGNVYLVTGTYNLQSGTISGGLEEGKVNALLGGSLYAAGGSVSITGGTISGGAAKTSGGNVYVTTATVTQNGGTITAGKSSGTAVTDGGGNVFVGASGTYNLQSGTLSGGLQSGTNAPWGGNLYAASNSTVNLTGGTISGGRATRGGNIATQWASVITLNFTSCTISGGYAATAGGNIYSRANMTLGQSVTVENGSSKDGGNIYNDNATVSIAGTITGGTATNNGGSICANSTVEITGGTISGGSAVNGGSIYAAKAVNITNADISGGTATKNGGNIYVAAATVTQNSGNVYGGKVTDGTGGGNVYVAAGATYDMKGGKIYGGKNLTDGEGATTVADSNGGNVLLNGIFSNPDTFTEATMNMSGDAEIYGGEAQNIAGNVRVYIGTLTMTGNAKIYNGVAGAENNYDNVMLLDSNLSMAGNAKIISASGEVSSAVAAGKYRRVSTITLADQASIVNAEDVKGARICRTYGGSTLAIAEGWNGTAYVDISDATQTPGALMETDYITCGNFTGDLFVYVENIRGYAENGAVRLASAGIVRDGEATWFANNAAAVDAYDYAEGEGGYLVLSGTAEIAKTVKIDLRGNDLTLTGTGIVYGLDNSNDDYDGYAKLTVDGGITVANEAFNGTKRYIALKETDGENTFYGFHKVELVLTHVTLRTNKAGLYYKSMIKSDAVLGSRCQAYGVVLSTDNMPGADFMDELSDINKYTMIRGGYTPDENDMVTMNSGSLFNIIKTPDAGRTAAANYTYVQMAVFANPYIAIDVNDDGNAVYFVGDTENGGSTSEGVNYSLLAVLDAIDEAFEGYKPEQQQLIKDTVNGWESWFTSDNWNEIKAELPNIFA